jgi:hypothetical protein
LQGAAAGPLHPRAGALPLDPKWKLAPVWCLTRMPLVYSDSHIAREAYCYCVDFGTDAFAGGVLGEPAGFH